MLGRTFLQTGKAGAHGAQVFGELVWTGPLQTKLEPFVWTEQPTTPCEQDLLLSVPPRAEESQGRT